MKKLLSAVKWYIKKSDMLLLVLCAVSAVFGIIMISSSTRYMETGSYVATQTVALVLGVIVFVIISLIDIDIIADKSLILFILSVLLISSLFVFGVRGDTGNRAWLRFGGFGIQPAELVKIPFIIILAHLIQRAKSNRGVSRPGAVISYVALFAVLFGLIIVSSADLGSALVYVFVFIVMLFFGGVSLWWFLIAAVVLGASVPYIWNNFLNANQKERILAPYDPTIDESGFGITWQANQSRRAIASGGFTGQGLFDGNMTQSGTVPKQHTDFIFSAVAEELGFIGCVIVFLLLLAIIVRCIYVGVKSRDTLSLLVCSGIAAMVTMQMLENIGMCLGLTPVIGLTLPFFSYGGSSVITNFLAMGIVSGIRMRPHPERLRRQQ